jgi:hypothetical protein
MVELLRSTDPVVMSFAGALLSQEGIRHHWSDQHMSIVGLHDIESRLFVPEEHVETARRVLAGAGLAQDA